MNTCIFCGKAIQRELSLSRIFSFQTIPEPIICEKCLAQFEVLDDKTACLHCFRKQEDTLICSDCLDWQTITPQLLPKHKAIYSYNEMAKQYLDQFKFQGDLLLSDCFQEELRLKLKPYQKTHHIVPIPLSHFGKERRGFNQVEMLLGSAGIVYEDWLVLGEDEKFRANVSRKIEKSVLIVDDMYSTGRTIFNARAVFENEALTESFSLFR